MPFLCIIINADLINTINSLFSSMVYLASINVGLSFSFLACFCIHHWSKSPIRGMNWTFPSMTSLRIRFARLLMQVSNVGSHLQTGTRSQQPIFRSNTYGKLENRYWRFTILRERISWTKESVAASNWESKVLSRYSAVPLRASSLMQRTPSFILPKYEINLIRCVLLFINISTTKIYQLKTFHFLKLVEILRCIKLFVALFFGVILL